MQSCSFPLKFTVSKAFLHSRSVDRPCPSALYQSPYHHQLLLLLLLLPDRRALMGSVSTYIVNHAACPVTVVKEMV